MISPVIKNMLVLATGTAGGQAIAFLTMPVVTRIFSPDDMGIFSVFTAVVELLVPFATLRYAAAIPLPRQKNTAAILFILCLLITAVCSTVSGLLLWLFGEQISKMYSVPELAVFWWLIAGGMFLAGIYETLVSWSTRNKNFKIIATSTMLQSIFAALVKILLGICSIKPLGLLLGKIFGQLSSVVFIAFDARHIYAASKRTLTWSRMRFLMARYVDFPKYQIASRFLLILSQKIPLLFFATMYGVGETGNLGLAMLVVTTPVLLVGQNTSQAFYAEIAKLGRKNALQIRTLARSLSIKLLLLSVIPVLSLMFFGKELFELVFGSQWSKGGTFAGILSIFMTTQFVSTSLIHIVSVFDRQRLYLLLNISRVALSALAFSVGYFLTLEGDLTLKLYSLFLAIQYGMTAYFVIEFIPGKEIKRLEIL